MAWKGEERPVGPYARLELDLVEVYILSLSVIWCFLSVDKIVYSSSSSGVPVDTVLAAVLSWSYSILIFVTW